MLSPSRSLLVALAAGLAVDAAYLPQGFKVRAPPREPALKAPEVMPRAPIQGYDYAAYEYDYYGYQAVDNQGNAIQIAQTNITNIQVSDQQSIVQQIQQSLEASSSNRNNDQLRLNSYASKSSDATVLLMVQEVQIIQQVNGYAYEYDAYDYYAYANDGNGNIQTRSVFVQSAITANQGLGITSTVMITASETLSITNNGGNNIGTGGLLKGTGVGGGNAKGTGAAAGTGKAAGTGAAGTGAAGAGAVKTVTTTVTITDVAPTYTAIAPDPAATKKAAPEPADPAPAPPAPADPATTSVAAPAVTPAPAPATTTAAAAAAVANPNLGIL